MKKVKIIKLGAVWCAPCRMLSPIFHKISEMKEFEGIDFYDLDIDDDDNYEIVSKYQIRSVPTILVLDENNEIVRKFVGAIPENQLVSMLKDIINE